MIRIVAGATESARVYLPAQGSEAASGAIC
jgi:hypothetical protein